MKNLLSIFEIIFEKEDRFQIIFLLIGFFLVSTIELAGVASILPFTAIVIDPLYIEQNVILIEVYNLFNFESSDDFIFYFGIAVIIILFLSNALNALVYWRSAFFVKMFTHKTSSRLLHVYSFQEYQFFTKSNASSLSTNILTQVDRVSEGMMLPIIIATSKLFTSLFIIVFLFVINPTVALLSFVTFITCYLLIFLTIKDYLGKSGQLTEMFSRKRYNIVTEILNGIKDIKVSGNIKLFLDRFEFPSFNYAKNDASVSVLAVLPKFALETIAFVGVIVMILIFLTNQQSSSDFIPLLSLYAMAGYKLLPSLQITYTGITQSKYHYPTLQSLVNDLKLNRENIIESHEDLGFAKKIKIENLSFKYEDDLILDNINLEIPQGNKIAIIGKTGSGKSTLLDIILGLYKSFQGTITIDDKILTETNTRSWQKNISFVPQNISLIDSTILNNITFGFAEDKIDLELINDVIEKSQLKKYVSDLPGNIKTSVGDRGLKISGGQRQRIGIARALYKNTNIMILDEATNALDAQTENKVINNILSMGKTIIMVTHRTETVKKFDKIFFLKDGKIFDQGNYNYLIENCPEFKKYIQTF